MTSCLVCLPTPPQSRARPSAAHIPPGSNGAARQSRRHHDTDPGTPRRPRRNTCGQSRPSRLRCTCRLQTASNSTEQLDLQHMWVASSAELFLERLHSKAHLVGETALDHGRGIAARPVQEMHSFWLGCQIVEVALAAHREIVHTDSFHRCWQGHRTSWPVGVGIVEPTLYPDSG